MSGIPIPEFLIEQAWTRHVQSGNAAIAEMRAPMGGLPVESRLRHPGGVST
ncbi:hypothetical protein GCM10020295_00960 [Streptomyces cinereospinus]